LGGRRAAKRRWCTVRLRVEHRPLNHEEHRVERHPQLPQFTAQQNTEIVLASLRGTKTMAELCREHDIADSLLRKWREQFLAAGAERLSGKAERTEVDELRARVSKLERALGRKTMEVEVAGELLRGWE
jgi:transposase